MTDSHQLHRCWCNQIHDTGNALRTMLAYLSDRIESLNDQVRIAGPFVHQFPTDRYLTDIVSTSDHLVGSGGIYQLEGALS